MVDQKYRIWQYQQAAEAVDPMAFVRSAYEKAAGDAAVDKVDTGTNARRAQLFPGQRLLTEQFNANLKRRPLSREQAGDSPNDGRPMVVLAEPGAAQCDSGGSGAPATGSAPPFEPVAAPLAALGRDTDVADAGKLAQAARERALARERTFADGVEFVEAVLVPEAAHPVTSGAVSAMPAQEVVPEAAAVVAAVEAAPAPAVAVPPATVVSGQGAEVTCAAFAYREGGAFASLAEGAKIVSGPGASYTDAGRTKTNITYTPRKS